MKSLGYAAFVVIGTLTVFVLGLGARLSTGQALLTGLAYAIGGVTVKLWNELRKL